MSQPKSLNQTAKYQNWHRHLEANQLTINGIDPRPLFSATATRDEALYFFSYEQWMALADIKALDGKSTGKESENEHMKLHIATFPEAQERMLTWMAFWLICCI